MDDKKVDLTILAQQMESLAEEAVDYADCALKASKKLKEYDPKLINSAVEIAFGRVRVRKDIPELAKGFFTKKGLQQRTHPVIAAHHASFFEGCNHVLEICTGLGFDTAALARKVKKVTTLERDPLTAYCARQNLKILGISNVEVLETSFEDYIKGVSSEIFDGVWADPDRRPRGGQRVKDASEYEPSLEQLMAFAGPRRCCIKVSPSLAFDALPSGWNKQWIGFQGECKEQLIIHSETHASPSVYLADSQSLWRPRLNLKLNFERFPESQCFTLIEPHPALSSSGMLDSFFNEQSIYRWDPHIVYGFSKEEIKTDPFYQKFQIFFSASYDEKKLRAKLSELHWDARTEIKKRAFPEEPEQVRKRLKLPQYKEGETAYGIVFLTSDGKKLLMFLGQRAG